MASRLRRSRGRSTPRCATGSSERSGGRSARWRSTSREWAAGRTRPACPRWLRRRRPPPSTRIRSQSRRHCTRTRRRRRRLPGRTPRPGLPSVVRLACNGAGLLGAVRAAVVNLGRHVDEINALNVFPVPDGDTGSNMLTTCTEMLRYVRDDSSVEGVVDRLREGALFGARGNSGVILSQVVRGLAEGFAGRRRFNGLDLAHALASASTAAYGAVPRPVEGTMLTVIREAAAAAVAVAERENDIGAVLAAATDAAEKALAKTPSLLPVLRDAGVVDAGGAGLLRLFEGALRFLRGDALAPAARAPAIPSPVPAGVATVETGHGYETVYLIHPFPGQLLDLDRISAYLVRTGESVNVAGDAKVAKIHAVSYTH